MNKQNNYQLINPKDGPKNRLNSFIITTSALWIVNSLSGPTLWLIQDQKEAMRKVVIKSLRLCLFNDIRSYNYSFVYLNAIK